MCCRHISRSNPTPKLYIIPRWCRLTTLSLSKHDTCEFYVSPGSVRMAPQQTSIGWASPVCWTRHGSDVGSMLGQRRRRWPSINSTSDPCLVRCEKTTFSIIYRTLPEKSCHHYHPNFKICTFVPGLFDNFLMRYLCQCLIRTILYHIVKWPWRLTLLTILINQLN